MPKSTTFTVPLAVTRTFSGFRSRCTTPAACAAPSAPATSIATATACSGENRDAPSTSRSERPSTYSLAMKRQPSASSNAYTVATDGCVMVAAARASRRRRSRCSGSVDTSGGNPLSATSRPRRRSRARYTTPMPPRPISRTTSYDPTRAPGRRSKAPAFGSSDTSSGATAAGASRKPSSVSDARRSSRTCATRPVFPPVVCSSHAALASFGSSSAA